MKKLLLLSLAALLLSGCADKKNYEAAVLAELQRDAKNSDPKEYKVDLEKMASCIVDMSSANMHGLFAYDTARLMEYRNYAKMLTLASSPDPKKTMEELKNDFGSVQKLTEARSNYIESQLECLATFVAHDENDKK